MTATLFRLLQPLPGTYSFLHLQISVNSWGLNLKLPPPRNSCTQMRPGTPLYSLCKYCLLRSPPADFYRGIKSYFSMYSLCRQPVFSLTYRFQILQISSTLFLHHRPLPKTCNTTSTWRKPRTKLPSWKKNEFWRLWKSLMFPVYFKRSEFRDALQQALPWSLLWGP